MVARPRRVALHHRRGRPFRRRRRRRRRWRHDGDDDVAVVAPGRAKTQLRVDHLHAGRAPTFLALLGNPFIVISALVAREISIWVGLAIAARGRRVKERNLDLVDAWEKEHAETKAQYERAGTPA